MSLFGEILDWMLAPLLLLWPMSIFMIYLVAQDIAHRPYDRALGDVVRAIARQVSVASGPDGIAQVRLEMPQVAADFLHADDSDRVYYQVLGGRGEFVAGDRAIATPDDAAPPLGRVRFRDAVVHGEPVRVAYVRMPLSSLDGERDTLVQLAETLDKRSRLANEIVKGVILPQFVILPVAVVLVWVALARGIKPLNRLQQRIRKRASGDLSPIDEHDVPDEVAPLVRAINDLLGRLDQSMRLQKRFVADAAHQLKTPLAGLRMQAELVERDIDAGQIEAARLKGSMRQIALSSQRAAHAVNQLLSLARAEDEAQALRRQPTNLAEIVIEAVRDFVPRAMDKRIDLGYEGPDAVRKAGFDAQPVLIRELVRNLIDNALHYTPGGGSVTARVTPDPFGQVVVLQVEDNGPGIPDAEKELVFQPFYRSIDTRIDGSGLGLAIVREVAQQHGAEVSVSDASPRGVGGAVGTLITVRFPVRHAFDAAAP